MNKRKKDRKEEEKKSSTDYMTIEKPLKFCRNVRNTEEESDRKEEIQL